MIETIEKAVEKLNEVFHNGEDTWEYEPQYETVYAHTFQYSEYDAIRIARSYELEEENSKLRGELRFREEDLGAAMKREVLARNAGLELAARKIESYGGETFHNIAGLIRKMKLNWKK